MDTRMKRSSDLPGDDGNGPVRHDLQHHHVCVLRQGTLPEGAFVHLQLPNYFRIELTIAKTLGVLALLIPSVPLKVKEFAYFGFAITLVSASIAHFAVGDAGRPPLYAFYIIDPLPSWRCSSFPIGIS